MIRKRPLPRALFPCLLAAAIAIAASGASPAPAPPSAGDLEVVVGEGGFLTCWLSLGPLPEASPAAAAIDPAGVREGAKPGPATWTAISSPARQVKLRSKKAGTWVLAASLKTDRARRLYLATGSDVGLEIFLNGRRLLERAEGRRAQPDTDLVPLDLGAGDNLLALRLSKGRGGAWSLYARLLDEQLRGAAFVDVRLPGALPGARRLLRDAARLEIDREVDLQRGAVRARLWLEFPGGRPVGTPAEARIRLKGAKGAAPADVALALPRTPVTSELLGEHELLGTAAPTAAIVDFAGGRLEARFSVRTAHVRTLAEARRLLAAAPAGAAPRTSVETAEFLIDHVAGLIEAGDEDARYLAAEADRALGMARELAAGRDPRVGVRGGIARLGYRSALDGRLHPYGLYVPPAWREDGEGRFGLVVALHGLNSFPLKTLTTLFGAPLAEDESKLERERRPLPVGAAPMFAVAPEGFGNSNYFAYGERDALDVIGRVAERYRIDPDRIYVTGASMGGTGAASLPLHNPDLFAAAAPLCGYHSVFEYDSVRGQALRPWERSAAARRSNVSWAENGRHLPLHVVHGTQDAPRTSEVLVRRYEQLGYEIAFEKPDAGHNVWDETYEDRWIFGHFKPLKRASHPRRVTFKTGRLRHSGAHWLRVDDAEDYSAFAKADATWQADGAIAIATENARALTVLQDEILAAGRDPRIEIDGVTFEPEPPTDGAWRFHKSAGRWSAGAEPCAAIACKRAGSSGPVDDVWHEPLLFVYGTADDDETAISRRLAQALSVPRPGVTVRYPVEADVEVSAADIASRSLVIVGTPAGNSLLARIADRLPIRALRGAVEAGGRRFEGDRVAAAFVFPNPLNPARYVLVYTGASKDALFYADHLPELLPDWVIFDASTWQTKGGVVLGADRDVLAAGFFDREWRL